MGEEYFVSPLEHVRELADKPFKHSFLQTERMLVGLNTLSSGQSQPIHEHGDQDKFYFVLSGRGRFTVGAASRMCHEGELILAPAGIAHGVENVDEESLSFLTVMAPFPT